MSKIFGGSKSKSTQTSTNSSSNLAYPAIQQNYGTGGATTFNAGANALNDELSGGFQGYRDKTGFDFFEKLGLNKVGGQFSGRGAFQSGAAMKGLANYENNLEKASYESYLDKLLKQAQLGLGAGGLVAGAGGVSSGTSSGTSTSSSSPGIGGFLGSIGSAVAASDRRLKENIVKIGQLSNGVNVYEYDYINDNSGKKVGVMAQELQEVMPEAVLTTDNGYLAVDYGLLRKAL